MIMDKLMGKNVFVDILLECTRQEAKWGVQDHPAISPAIQELGVVEQARRVLREQEYRAKAACEADARSGTTNWGNILFEEFAEAVHEAALDPLSESTRNELVQVAAVVVSWIESLDRARAALGRTVK